MLLQRLSDSAHRQIIGPQVESTPALGRAVQHWPTAVERLCSVLARLSPWSQLGRLLLLQKVHDWFGRFCLEPFCWFFFRFRLPVPWLVPGQLPCFYCSRAWIVKPLETSLRCLVPAAVPSFLSSICWVTSPASPSSNVHREKNQQFWSNVDPRCSSAAKPPARTDLFARQSTEWQEVVHFYRLNKKHQIFFAAASQTDVFMPPVSVSLPLLEFFSSKKLINDGGWGGAAS